MSIDFRPYLRRRRGSGALSILTALLTGVDAYDQGREQRKARLRGEQAAPQHGQPPTAATTPVAPPQIPTLQDRLGPELWSPNPVERERYKRRLIENGVDPLSADRAASEWYPDR